MKKLHKTAAAVLALGMMFSSVPMVASANAVTIAAGDLTQDQVIEKAKQYVNLPEGFMFRQASYHEGGKGQYVKNAVWNVNFSSENRRVFSWITVSIDAKTGALLNMDIHDEDKTTFDKTISRDEARTKAIEYANKVAGNKMKFVEEIEIDTSMDGPKGVQPRMETFRFVRMVDGIPFPTDSITVRVGADGNIRGYNYSWNEELKFPKATPAITEEQAAEAFRKSLNLELQYQRAYQPYATEAVYQLVYGQQNGMFGGEFPQIDAGKGVAIDMLGEALTPVVKREWKPIADKATDSVKKNVNKDEALESINALGLVSSEYKLDGATFDSNGEFKSWRFSFSAGDPQTGANVKHMQISVDAATGELQHMYKYNNGGSMGSNFPAKPTLSEEQAQQKAVDFLKKALPTRIDKVALASGRPGNAKMGPQYGFSFVHLVDGVPLYDTTIRVMIDPMSGEVLEAFLDRPAANAKPMPSKDKVMKADEATQKFVEKNELQLQYMAVYDKGTHQYESKPKEAVLVYAPKPGAVFTHLNALTGEWTTPWGDSANPVTIADIKGHWAEKQLQFFAEAGIFKVAEGKLSPDAKVTRGDMVRYLILSLNGPRMQMEKSSYADVPQASENFEFIEEALARKWLNKDDKNFRPDDEITRAELAELIATALGYQALSETTGTFKSNYTDITESDKRYYGDVSIVSALGIMSGTDGKFDPSQGVTKAQAAVVLTRVLDQYKSNIINYNYFY